MNSPHRWIRAAINAVLCSLSLCAMPSAAQVGPAEITDPRLKALEQAYLHRLVEWNRAIGECKFPFAFKLSRYAALDPQQQIGADARGLEFVNFHGRPILKVTGNYNAAYSADVLTANERADRVFSEVIAPILRMLAVGLDDKPDFDTLGFEIAYHTRRQNHQFSYEGKEILVVVMDRADVGRYAAGGDEMGRQSILNRSEIYLDGKPFGLALGAREPFEVAGLRRAVQSSPSVSPPAAASTRQDTHQALQDETIRPVSFQRSMEQASATSVAMNRVPGHGEELTDNRGGLPALEQKYRPALDRLAKEGVAKYHFVDYAPPGFVNVRNRIALQLTLRNPDSFERDTTSIYRRAAQGFDLFFATELKAILDLLPNGAEFEDLDVTILDELVMKSGRSSEALEFIFPMDSLRKFAAADVTNQELINRSVVLVNGVRIALNLQQVE